MKPVQWSIPTRGALLHAEQSNFAQLVWRNLHLIGLCLRTSQDSIHPGLVLFAARCEGLAWFSHVRVAQVVTVSTIFMSLIIFLLAMGSSRGDAGL